MKSLLACGDVSEGIIGTSVTEIPEAWAMPSKNNISSEPKYWFPKGFWTQFKMLTAIAQHKHISGNPLPEVIPAHLIFKRGPVVGLPSLWGLKGVDQVTGFSGSHPRSVSHFMKSEIPSTWVSWRYGCSLLYRYIKEAKTTSSQQTLGHQMNGFVVDIVYC